MPHPFDPGCFAEPFRTLCMNYPEADVYPPSQFRVEWGPIFHRGRLDGSARILVLGQDPAQHETVIRRVLVGEAGRRIQGFLLKLGITQSYVIVNTFLYSVFGAVKAAVRRDPRLVAYRNSWLNALLSPPGMQAVVALGTAAGEAWDQWRLTSAGSSFSGAFAQITHPTQPESSSQGDRTKLAAATKSMLRNWNAGLQTLAPAIANPDVSSSLALYGDVWADGDRVPIPEADIPEGLPSWMHENDGWAVRKGSGMEAKRRNITLTVPRGVIP